MIRLVESGFVSTVTVVHVDNIFAARQKSRCDQFHDELSLRFPANNLGKLKWYALVAVFSGF